jgi:hypothetical protein
MPGTGTLSGVFTLRCALSLTFAGRGILTGVLTIPILSFLSATCVTRDMLATAQTRDMLVTCVTRDRHALTAAYGAGSYGTGSYGVNMLTDASTQTRDMTASAQTRDERATATTRS